VALRQQLGQAHQIVGSGCEREGQLHPLDTAEAGLGLARDRFDLAERLLNALADALTDRVARMPGGASING
jgi:hypothetical protein